MNRHDISRVEVGHVIRDTNSPSFSKYIDGTYILDYQVITKVSRDNNNHISIETSFLKTPIFSKHNVVYSPLHVFLPMQRAIDYYLTLCLKLQPLLPTKSKAWDIAFKLFMSSQTEINILEDMRNDNICANHGHILEQMPCKNILPIMRIPYNTMEFEYVLAKIAIRNDMDIGKVETEML